MSFFIEKLSSPTSINYCSSQQKSCFAYKGSNQSDSIESLEIPEFCGLPAIPAFGKKEMNYDPSLDDLSADLEEIIFVPSLVKNQNQEMVDDFDGFNVLFLKNETKSVILKKLKKILDSNHFECHYSVHLFLNNIKGTVFMKSYFDINFEINIKNESFEVRRFGGSSLGFNKFWLKLQDLYLNFDDSLNITNNNCYNMDIDDCISDAITNEELDNLCECLSKNELFGIDLLKPLCAALENNLESMELILTHSNFLSMIISLVKKDNFITNQCFLYLFLSIFNSLTMNTQNVPVLSEKYDIIHILTLIVAQKNNFDLIQTKSIKLLQKFTECKEINLSSCNNAIEVMKEVNVC